MRKVRSTAQTMSYCHFVGEAKSGQLSFASRQSHSIRTLPTQSATRRRTPRGQSPSFDCGASECLSADGDLGPSDWDRSETDADRVGSAWWESQLWELSWKPSVWPRTGPMSARVVRKIAPELALRCAHLRGQLLTGRVRGGRSGGGGGGEKRARTWGDRWIWTKVGATGTLS